MQGLVALSFGQRQTDIYESALPLFCYGWLLGLSKNGAQGICRRLEDGIRRWFSSCLLSYLFNRYISCLWPNSCTRLPQSQQSNASLHAFLSTGQLRIGPQPRLVQSKSVPFHLEEPPQSAQHHTPQFTASGNLLAYTHIPLPTSIRHAISPVVPSPPLAWLWPAAIINQSVCSASEMPLKCGQICKRPS